MQQLHEAVGEAVNLGIRHEDEIIYLERTSSGRSLVRVVYLVGGRAPLHLTSVGKLFLAADGAAEVRAYARRTGLPGKTPHSLTHLDALEKELDKIRRHEFADDNEEAEIGLRCIAAPIRDDEGPVSYTHLHVVLLVHRRQNLVEILAHIGFALLDAMRNLVHTHRTQ